MFQLKYSLAHLATSYSVVTTQATESGLKVGRMTRTIWVTRVTFLMGQVGLIRKLNYLDVTQILNRSHVLKKAALASDKQVIFAFGECTESLLV